MYAEVGKLGQTLPYRTIPGREGESKERDFAWLVVSMGTTKEGKASWRAAGDVVKESIQPVQALRHAQRRRGGRAVHARVDREQAAVP